MEDSSHSECPHVQNCVHVRKSHTVYVLLGLLLGNVGAHNFYAGYIKKGVIQVILTFTLIGAIPVIVWIIYEVFTVKQDADGVPFATE